MKIGGSSEKAPLIQAATLSLPKERNVPNELIGDYSLLLYGREKIGKTSFAAEFPDAFFLMCEPGGKDLEIFSREVKDWKSFTGYIDLLEKNPGKFKTVVVDTADRCYKLCEEAVHKKMLIKHASEGDFGTGWSMPKEEFARQIIRLLQLGRGVIFTSHATEKEIKSRSGSKYDRVVPTMSKQAREVLEPIVDIWAYMEYGEGEDRQLHLRGDSHLAAGHRLQNHFKGVDQIPMGKTAKDAYTNFVAAFDNSLDLAEDKPKKKFTIKA